MEYQELNERGNEEAVKIYNDFLTKLNKMVKKAASDFYINALPFIESDAWVNYRTDIFNNLCYSGLRDGHDWVAVRRKIYEENKEDIQNEIIKDLEKEIQQRTNVLHWMREQNIRSYRDVAAIIAEYYARPEEFYAKVSIGELETLATAKHS